MDRLVSPSPPPPPPPSTELFLPSPPPPPPAPPSTSRFAGTFGGYSSHDLTHHPSSRWTPSSYSTTSFFSSPPQPVTREGHSLTLVIGDPGAVHHHLVTEHVLGVPYSFDLLPFEDYDDQLGRSFQSKCSLKNSSFSSTFSSSRREFPVLNETVTRKLLTELLNTQTLVTELEILVSWAPLTTVGEAVRLINALGPRLKALTFRCGPLFSEDYPTCLEGLSSGQQSSSTSSNLHTRHLITTALELMKLLQAINEPNRLPKLESLTLDLRHDLRLVRPLQMPLLGQLRRFSFASKGTALFLFESLIRFGEPNDLLDEVSIGNCTPWSAYLQYFDRSPLRERFRQLSYLPHGRAGVPPESTYLHSRFLATFTGLRSFSLSPAILAGLDLVGWLGTILRPLTSLEHLNLLLTQELLHRKPRSAREEEDEEPPIPLLSVRVLVIQMMGFHHRQLRCCRHWRELFPNLEVVRVNHYTTRARCRFCVVPKLTEDEEEIERLRREAEEESEERQNQQQQKALSIIENVEQHRLCAARLIAPLKACPLLRKVYYYTMPAPKGSDAYLEFTREDF